MIDNTDLYTNRYLQNQKIYMQYRKESHQYKWDLHSHDGYEIYYFQKGVANYIIGDCVYPLSPGDLLIFNGQIPHHAKPSLEVSYIRSFINFLPSYINDSNVPELSEAIFTLFNKPNGVLIRCEEVDRQEIERLFFQISSEYEQEVFGFELMIKSYFIQLLLRIYRKASLVDFVADHTTQKEQHVQRILSIINQNFENELSLDDLSKMVHLNKHYMCHCFKEITGFTIHKYIAKRRIDEAKKLLRMSNKSVGDISEAIGVFSIAQFSRLFKQNVGVSPQLFRKMYRDKLET